MLFCIHQTLREYIIYNNNRTTLSRAKQSKPQQQTYVHTLFE
jgi:hypothetical protein